MRSLFFILALVAPMPALALSCLAPSVERSYAQYAADEDLYYVVHGRLTLDMSELPNRATQNKLPPEMTKIEGQLSGSVLTPTGFKQPFEQDLLLEVSCISRWCGSVESGEIVLAFVRKDAEGYALAVSPCGGAVFDRPTPALLKQAKQCMTQGSCTVER